MAAVGTSVIPTSIAFCPEDQNLMGWDGTGQRNGVRNLISSSARSAYLTQNEQMKTSSVYEEAWVTEFPSISLSVSQNVVPGTGASTSACDLEMLICGPHPRPMELETLSCTCPPCTCPPSGLDERGNLGNSASERRHGCQSKDSHALCCRNEKCTSKYQLWETG